MSERIAKNSLIIAASTVLSRLSGFLREVTFAYIFGVSAVMDVYVVAVSIIDSLGETMRSAIVNSVLPVYRDVEEKEGTDAAARYLGSIMLLALVLGLAVAGVIGGFAGQLAKLVAPGFDEGKRAMVTGAFPTVCWAVMFWAIFGVLAAAQQARFRFFCVATNSLPSNLCLVATVAMLAGKYGLKAALAGFVLGSFARVVYQLPGVFQAGARMRFSVGLWACSRIKSTMAIMGTSVVGVSLMQANLLIDRLFASKLSDGSIAALMYANKVAGVCTAVILMPVVTAAFPVLAKMGTHDRLEEFFRSLERVLTTLLMVGMPFVVIVMVNSEQIVELIYKRGAFDEFAVKTTASALFFFAPIIILWAMNDMVVKSCYALQHVKSTLIATGVSFAANVLLMLILVDPLKQGGIALANSISTGLSVVIMICLLRRAFKKATAGWGLKFMTKLLAVTTMIFCTGIGFKMSFPANSPLIQLAVGSIAVLASCALGARLFFRKELQGLTELVTTFCNRIF